MAVAGNACSGTCRELEVVDAKMPARREGVQRASRLPSNDSCRAQPLQDPPRGEIASPRRERRGPARACPQIRGQVLARAAAAGTDAHFTHFDAAGQAHMVDVAAKDVTRRVARAGGRIAMQPRNPGADSRGNGEERRRAGRRAHRGDPGREAHGRPHSARPSAAADPRGRRRSSISTTSAAIAIEVTVETRRSHRRRDGGADRASPSGC